MSAHDTKQRSHVLRGLLLAGLTFVAGAAGLARQGPAHHDDSHRSAVSHSSDVGGPGNVVTDWNRLATEIFPVDVGPVIDARAMAILHAAMALATVGGSQLVFDDSAERVAVVAPTDRLATLAEIWLW